MNPSPGPWRWGKNEHCSCRDHKDVILDAAGAEVVGGTSGHCGDAVQVGDDDGELIQAAPEMREMLLKLEWQRDDDFAYCATCSAGRRDDSRSKKPLTHEAGCALAALLERIR